MMILQVKFLLFIESKSRVFIFFVSLADRARDLSTYCSDLLKLPRYLSESSWVQDQLFGIHEGDIETDIDPSASRPTSHSNYETLQSTPVPTPAPAPTTTTTTTTTATTTTTTSTIKVKIIYKDEIFAIKVPTNSTIDFLQGKILDRLGFNTELKYKEGDRLLELNTTTFESAVKIGKLTVVAS
jgi:bud emergence protein 1